MKYKKILTVASITLSTVILFHGATAAEPSKGVGKNTAEQREERVYVLLREAAAYPVTDVAGCIAGVNFASSLYADLLRQGALQSEEYTKFSIKTQLRFASENGTPVDLNVFWIVFEMLRTNNASWTEVSENAGRDYAQQTALLEAITCKFNSGYTGIQKIGPLPKDTVTQIVNQMLAEKKRSN